MSSFMAEAVWQCYCAAAVVDVTTHCDGAHVRACSNAQLQIVSSEVLLQSLQRRRAEGDEAHSRDFATEVS